MVKIQIISEKKHTFSEIFSIIEQFNILSSNVMLFSIKNAFNSLATAIVKYLAYLLCEYSFVMVHVLRIYQIKSFRSSHLFSPESYAIDRSMIGIYCLKLQKAKNPARSPFNTGFELFYFRVSPWSKKSRLWWRLLILSYVILSK